MDWNALNLNGLDWMDRAEKCFPFIIWINFRIQFLLSEVVLHDFLMFSNINGLEMIESLAADVGEVQGRAKPVFCEVRAELKN